jgi:very-short-patch-repair endonuclease
MLRGSMTKEERLIYYRFLKRLPVTVNRQKQIGGYIVDFFIAEERLVIEIDGSQHYSEEGKRADAERDNWLISQGMRVIRYSNYDVNGNFEGVCTDILKHINEKRAVKIEL